MLQHILDTVENALLARGQAHGTHHISRIADRDRRALETARGGWRNARTTAFGHVDERLRSDPSQDVFMIMGAGPARPEPVTAEAARPVRWPLLTLEWRDLTFLHWPVDAVAAGRLMPPGAVPDLHDGVSYVGLVAFRMYRVGWLGLPGLPYLGSFPETNVRLYSVGPDGRRGVVFCSLDAARLLPVLVARAGFRLPYQWSLMRVRQRGDVVSYASRRRWPRPGARLRLRIRIGEPLDRPSALEQFLTARWGLHAAWYGGRTLYLPNEHPRWALHRAMLVHLEENLIQAVGLPPPESGPVSVLYSTGLPVRMGRPARPAGGDRPS
jgi:uncharacterized protein YqjF (DUF2071 family)